MRCCTKPMVPYRCCRNPNAFAYPRCFDHFGESLAHPRMEAQQFASCHIDQSLGFVPTKDILVPITHHQSLHCHEKKIAFGQCMGCQCLLLCHSALWPCGFAYHHEPCGFAFFVARMAWHHSWQRFSFLWWVFFKISQILFGKNVCCFWKKIGFTTKKSDVGEEEK